MIHRRCVLITGASSGLGAAFAARLSEERCALLLVARRLERMTELASELRERSGGHAEVLAADLADPADLAALERRLAESRIDLLVNSAGFGAFGPFSAIDPNTAEAVIRVQVTAVTRLTRAALPGMLKRGSGAVINVSSRLAWSAALGAPPMPARAVYAGAKAYINTFTRILHSELEGSGVQVQALCPGLMRTEFFGAAGAAPASLPEAVLMAPEDVVDASLASLRLGEPICVPALDEPGILDEIDAAHRRLFDHSQRGAVAERYRLRPAGMERLPFFRYPDSDGR